MCGDGGAGGARNAAVLDEDAGNAVAACDGIDGGAGGGARVEGVAFSSPPLSSSSDAHVLMYEGEWKGDLKQGTCMHARCGHI